MVPSHLPPSCWGTPSSQRGSPAALVPGTVGSHPSDIAATSYQSGWRSASPHWPGHTSCEISGVENESRSSMRCELGWDIISSSNPIIWWNWSTFKSLSVVNPLVSIVNLQLSSCSFFWLIYQVWLMTKVDRFSSVPNRTQQEPERCLLIWGAWHQSEAPEHVRHTHACLRARSYTNKTGRHANTCARTHISKHAGWWTGTIMILNNW